MTDLRTALIAAIEAERDATPRGRRLNADAVADRFLTTTGLDEVTTATEWGVVEVGAPPEDTTRGFRARTDARDFAGWYGGKVTRRTVLRGPWRKP